MIRRRGDAGFAIVSWDDALDVLARGLRGVDPQRAAFYLTSRGITNETYYVAQKAARVLGTNHVDNSARLCHAASTAAMKTTLGHGASTCSYADWLDADLIVFFGSNTPNNQPVTTKYLLRGHPARRADRGREHLSRAGTGALLGAVDRRRARSSGRGSPTTGSTCTRAETWPSSSACSARSIEDGAASTASSSSARPRASRPRRRPRSPPTGTRSRRKAARGSGHAPVRAPAEPSVPTRSSSGRWGSPSTRTASTPSTRWSTSASRAACPAGRAAG